MNHVFPARAVIYPYSGMQPSSGMDSRLRRNDDVTVKQHRFDLMSTGNERLVNNRF